MSLYQCTCSCGGVDSSLSLRCWHALYPVHTRLENGEKSQGINLQLALHEGVDGAVNTQYLVFHFAVNIVASNLQYACFDSTHVRLRLT